MPTQAQIDANRRNAQKSTGPRTPEGKARVALNALVHGIRASAFVATLQRTPIFDEDPQDFVDLLQSLADHFHPQGPAEQACVEDIAICRWRLRRVICAETGHIASAQQILSTGPGAQNPRLHERNRLPDFAVLEKLDRYETSIQRQLKRSLDTLTTLIHQRSNGGQAHPPTPIPSDSPAPTNPTETYPAAPASAPQPPAVHRALSAKQTQSSKPKHRQKPKSPQNGKAPRWRKPPSNRKPRKGRAR